MRRKIITSVLTLLLVIYSAVSNVAIAQEVPTPPPVPTPPTLASREIATPPTAPTAPTSLEAMQRQREQEQQQREHEQAQKEQAEKEARERNGVGQPKASNNPQATPTAGNGTTNANKVGDVSLVSGEANATGTLGTNANSNILGTSGEAGTGSDGDTSVSNTGNGSSSTNNGSVNASNQTNANLNNNLNLTNSASMRAESGNNTASENVGDTSIITKDANVSATIFNTGNANGMGMAQFAIEDDHNGDIVLAWPQGNACSVAVCPTGNTSASNTGNGSNSANTADITQDNASNVQLENTAMVGNTLHLEANSGDNRANDNVGNTTIETGDANVAANVVNAINSNLLGGALFVIDIFGNLVGDIILPTVAGGDASGSSSGTAVGNAGNGSDSTNTASASQTNTTNLDMNNNAALLNVIDVDANTGNNGASDNTGGSSTIDSGEATVDANVINFANVNAAGVGGNENEPIWLVFVNEAGNWIGKILGADPNATMAASPGLVVSTDADGNMIVKNAQNGSGSDNTASAGTTNTQNIAMTNNATVNNTLDITANTGRNSANGNTGGNSNIKTGDTNVVANIVNFVNTNFIGRPVMVALVNVFGSWKGDVITPGHKQENKMTQASSQNTQQASQSNAQSEQHGSTSTSQSQQASGQGKDNMNTMGINGNTAAADTAGGKTVAKVLPRNNTSTGEAEGTPADTTEDEQSHTGDVAGSSITITADKASDSLKIFWPFVIAALVLPMGVAGSAQLRKVKPRK